VTNPDLTNTAENFSKDEFNILTWTYDLKSGKSETVSLEYTIESSPDREIVTQEQTEFKKTSY